MTLYPATRPAEKLLAAARIKAEAESNGIAQPMTPADKADLAFAGKLEAAATATLPPDQHEIGAGGELVPHGDGHHLPAHYRNTLQSPSYIAADASRGRLDQASAAGVLEATLDLCDTIGAQDSSERMLAGQLAMLHKLTMKAGARANDTLERMEGICTAKDRELYTVQANRLVNTVARATAEFQNGLLTLQRKRSGGKQNITVTHIQNTQVNKGGQAVVTSGPVVGGQGAAKAGEDQ